MQNIDHLLNEFFGDVHRFSIGLEPTFRTIDQVRAYQAQASYPPYDLIKLSDNSYRINMAVAGFKISDLDISVENNILTIKSVDSGEVRPVELVLHKGISTRDFTRKFYLSDYVEVTESNLIDGILSIELVRNVPEELLPRKIVIGTNQPALTTTVVNGTTNK